MFNIHVNVVGEFNVLNNYNSTAAKTDFHS